MKQPTISIIIPVYNGEKYLPQCLDSILAQSYPHWELLLIDDGSKDSSGSICEAYAQKDSRIKAIHQQNSGQAAARNAGVAIATGDYISFIDCDDWIDSDMYQTMVSTLQQQQAEVIICGYIEEYDGRQKHVHTDETITVYDAMEAVKLVLQNRIGSYLWSMLFQRDVVQEKMPDLNPYEDHATIFKWISHARRVVLLNHAFYHYRQLGSSSLHSYNPKRGNHYFGAIKERYHYITDHQLLPGWESENRRLYLRSCIKLAKDLARIPDYDTELKTIILEVRDELKTFLPIRLDEVGLKYYLRLRLLMLSPDAFVSVLRFTSSFSLKRRKESKTL